MCNHHFVIEYRDGAGDNWERLETIHFSNEIAGRASSKKYDPAYEKAQETARLYLDADPDRAEQLVIQYYDCNGAVSDAEFPGLSNDPLYIEGRTGQRERELAQEVLRLRKALIPYTKLRIENSDKGTRIFIPKDTDRGATEALYGGEDE